MAYKVYPSDDQKEAVCCENYMSSKEETKFTIWMKSLVCNANGCTIFDSKGEIVYRVDNYDQKCSDEVFLMDLRGNVLFTIQKKISLFSGRWNGYRWTSSETTAEEKPWFQVKRYSRLLMGCSSSFQVITAGNDKYWIVKSAVKEAYTIMNANGEIIAEVNRKLSSWGILLGEDVLTLNVRPHIDHSFVVALVIVNGLVNGKL